MSDSPFPPGFFDRADESADDQFYREARLVTHIDDATIDAIREAYAELLPSGAAVLDLMSSWISHLPPSAYERVSGLGMNEHELVANPQLDDHVVHDLNREPELPYTDRSFDAVLNAVSIQYLTRPVDVYASVRRVLRPGGLAIVATSHRIFPTKAIRGWQQLQPVDRPRLVAHYLQEAGGYEAAEILDRSPAGADPLWLVCARTTGGASR